MPERSRTSEVIQRIEETQSILDKLIKYNETLEKDLGKIKGSAEARRWIRKVIKYLKHVKNKLLPSQKKEMVELHKMAVERIKKIEEQKKRLKRI